MRIAILTSDNRERFKDYNHPTPYFGPAPEALLQGFAALGRQMEVHVISCLQESAPAPEKIADNMWYHAVRVPKMGWMRTLYQGCIRAVRKKLHEIQPDIVHGQGTERECAMCAIYSGFPNVLTIHGNMLTVARHLGGAYWGISAKLETFALKRTIGVLCNSAYTESLVAPRTKRTWRVPNALRKAFFEQPVNPDRGKLPVILNIGEIVSYKRQREILEVARKLHQRAGRGGHRRRRGVCRRRTRRAPPRMVCPIVSRDADDRLGLRRQPHQPIEAQELLAVARLGDAVGC